MGEKVRCEICDRIFKDQDGLAQHKTAKHNEVAGVKKEKNFKKIRNWAIFICIIGLIIAAIIWVVSSTISGINYCKTAPVTEINIVSHSNVKLHIHSHLHIFIDGEEQIIPANIGIAPNFMRPLHTHDLDNEIHMEGPCPRDFRIEEFFYVWGKEFNSQCIFDKCTDKGELKMSVNGIDNKEFENYVMKDGDDIVIDYSSRK